MSLLSDPVREKAAKLLANLPNPVKLVVFTQEMECPHCRENRMLVEEVGSLSDQLTVEVYNLLVDAEKAKEHGVDKVPAVCVVGADDPGIHFYGIPAGFEFTSLLQSVGIVGSGDSGLSSATREKLGALGSPVDIQVFVTLTCPVCPLMATLAHRFALESRLVRASVIDAGEFPLLASLYEVMTVPKTVVNRKVFLDGPVPEARLLEGILEAVPGDKTG